MNRPVKFRVWDNELKKFGNPDQYGLILRYGLIHGKEKHPEYGIYYNPDVIIQQYTGLNDSNGKEIYEGDIIRAMHDFGPAGFRSHISVVRWDKEVGYQWEYWDLSTIEIIGNIHENSKFLK